MRWKKINKLSDKTCDAICNNYANFQLEDSKIIEERIENLVNFINEYHIVRYYFGFNCRLTYLLRLLRFGTTARERKGDYSSNDLCYLSNFFDHIRLFADNDHKVYMTVAPYGEWTNEMIEKVLKEHLNDEDIVYKKIPKFVSNGNAQYLIYSEEK